MTTAICILISLFITFGGFIIPAIREVRKSRVKKITQSNPFEDTEVLSLWDYNDLNTKWRSFKHGTEDYTRYYEAVTSSLRGSIAQKEPTRTSQLFQRMKKIYDRSNDPITRAAVATMLTGHLLPSWRTFKVASNDDGAARSRYHQILNAISDNVAVLEDGYNAGIEFDQEVMLKHLQSVRESLRPRRSSLDIE